MCSVVVRAILAERSTTGARRSCTAFSMAGLTYWLRWGYCCSREIWKGGRGEEENEEEEEEEEEEEQEEEEEEILSHCMTGSVSYVPEG